MLGKTRSAASLDDYRARSDISRLLDPSYTTSYYHSQQSSTYRAYVDAQGNMHDPDYRAFPLIQQPSHTRRTMATTRPHWELAEDTALDEDLQEDPKRHSSASSRHYPSSLRSSSPSGGMRIYPRSIAFSISNDISSPISWSPSSSDSSSPFSASSTMLNPFESSSSVEDVKEVKEKSRCRIASSLKRRRRRSAGTTASEKEKRISQEFDDDEYLSSTFQEKSVWEEDDEDDEGRRVEEGDCVPTCAESLKKQWQALSLRIQFGLFRAEKRIKRRLRSLL